MSKNSDAVNAMYVLAQGDGYKKSRDEFNTLVGFGDAAPKKKEDSVSIATEIVSVSESQQPQEDTTSVISPESLPLPYVLKYDPDVVAEGEVINYNQRPVVIIRHSR